MGSSVYERLHGIYCTTFHLWHSHRMAFVLGSMIDVSPAVVVLGLRWSFLACCYRMDGKTRNLLVRHFDSELKNRKVKHNSGEFSLRRNSIGSLYVSLFYTAKRRPS